MDISFYTLANAAGIACAAAAFLIFLRRTARGQQERDETDNTSERPGARQETGDREAPNADTAPGKAPGTTNGGRPDTRS